MLAINYLQRCWLVRSEQLRLLGKVKAGVSLLPPPEGVAHLRVTVSSTSQQLGEITLVSAYSQASLSKLSADQELVDT